MRAHRPTERVWRPRGTGGMTRTIERLMARLAADLGRTPTDAELAATLAISVKRVQHHRLLLCERTP